MTYRFEQFKTEISNPTVSINLNTISDRAIDQLLSINILLKTDTASFGVRAEDMPYNETWEDSEVQGMVNNWLIQFEI